MAWSMIGAKGIMQSLSGTLYLAIAYLISCTVAGYMQAKVANLLGDEDIEPTIDPLAYIDPIGFLCSCFFYIGWWRLVPVNTDIAYGYRFPHFVILLMYGIRSIAHFMLSCLCYLVIRLYFGSLLYMQVPTLLTQLSSWQRVLFSLLIFLFFFNIVQTIFQGLLAIVETVIIAASGNKPEFWGLTDHLILIAFPLLMLFIFGDTMIASMVKFFMLAEQGIKMLIGLLVGRDV